MRTAEIRTSSLRECLGREAPRTREVPTAESERWDDHRAPASGARPYAESQAACEALRDQFVKRYRQLAPKAVERLLHDWERLMTLYQCPAEASGRHKNTIPTVIEDGQYAPLRFRIPEDDGLRVHDVDTASPVVARLQRRTPDF